MPPSRRICLIICHLTLATVLSMLLCFLVEALLGPYGLLPNLLRPGPSAPLPARGVVLSYIVVLVAPYLLVCLLRRKLTPLFHRLLDGLFPPP